MDANRRYSQANMTMEKIVQKRALDVTPHNHALWCSVGGDSEPFANAIDSRQWSQDGARIIFLLDTHNSFSAKPDELIDVIEAPWPVNSVWYAEWALRDQQDMANRPAPMADCPHCKGSGKVSERLTK